MKTALNIRNLPPETGADADHFQHQRPFRSRVRPLHSLRTWSSTRPPASTSRIGRLNAEIVRVVNPVECLYVPAVIPEVVRREQRLRRPSIAPEPNDRIQQIPSRVVGQLDKPELPVGRGLSDVHAAVHDSRIDSREMENYRRRDIQRQHDQHSDSDQPAFRSRFHRFPSASPLSGFPTIYFAAARGDSCPNFPHNPPWIIGRSAPPREKQERKCVFAE